MSAEGIDVSDFQVDLTAHDLSGLSFAFTKATDGLSITDPHFAANWATIKAARLHRGTYHELQAGLPVSQAAHFLAVVQGGGLEPGDMLSVVASDYPGVTDDDVLAFCEAVQHATHGHNPVLAYTDLSVGANLRRTSAAGFPLWVAWPSPVAPAMPLANWRSWRLWQWGTRFIPGLGNVDADAYNGTPADMDAWIASYKPKPPPSPKPHLRSMSGDEMFYLPNGAGAVATLPVPAAVPQADGTFAPPSVLRLCTNSACEVETQQDQGSWSGPFPIDYNRGPNLVTLHAATAEIKVKRVDGGSNLIAADFA